jgi:hypothetical protein
MDHQIGCTGSAQGLEVERGSGRLQTASAKRLSEDGRAKVESAPLPMALESEPYVWLRPFFKQLQQHPPFRHFASAHQFEQLLQAIAAEHPTEAAQMRQWTATAQHMLLLHLASMVEQKASAEPIELWRVQKGDRELRCVAHYLPNGIDLRLMEGSDFRRTQLAKDAPAVNALAENWKTALKGRGWLDR